MPYLLLGLGTLIGFYGLYKFFLNATPKQVSTMFLVVVTGALALALFVLALTGRLPIALAALSALWPLGVAVYRKRLFNKPDGVVPGKPLTRSEAFEILGLPDTATEDEIQDAYKRLIIKVHPDQQGSEWMAAKLNAARDFLLKK
jgi:hypothetical protein